MHIIMMIDDTWFPPTSSDTATYLLSASSISFCSIVCAWPDCSLVRGLGLGLLVKAEEPNTVGEVIDIVRPVCCNFLNNNFYWACDYGNAIGY